MKNFYRMSSLVFTGFVFYQGTKAADEDVFHPYRIILILMAGLIIFLLEKYGQDGPGGTGEERTPDPNIPQRQEVAPMSNFFSSLTPESGRGNSGTSPGLRTMWWED